MCSLLSSVMGRTSTPARGPAPKTPLLPAAWTVRWRHRRGLGSQQTQRLRVMRSVQPLLRRALCLLDQHTAPAGSRGWRAHGGLRLQEGRGCRRVSSLGPTPRRLGGA